METSTSTDEYSLCAGAASVGLADELFSIPIRKEDLKEFISFVHIHGLVQSYTSSLALCHNIVSRALDLLDILETAILVHYTDDTMLI